MDNTINTKIENAISRINTTIKRHEFLFDLIKTDEIPHIKDIESGGVFIQSVYNGIENIAAMILKNINEDILNNDQWHKNLLNKAFEHTENSIALFDIKYKEELNSYKSFRHVFRHIYGDEINWNEVKPLLKGIKKLWENIKYDINNFIKNYDPQNKVKN